MSLATARAVLATTARLVLRRFTRDDVGFLRTLMDDPAYRAAFGDAAADDREAYAWLDRHEEYRAADRWTMDCIESRDTGRPIGFCGFGKHETLDAPDLIAALLPDARGLGYGLEVCRAQLDLARDRWKRRRVVAVTDGDNDAAIATLLRLGFVCEGEWSPWGRPCGQLVFGVDLHHPQLSLFRATERAAAPRPMHA